MLRHSKEIITANVYGDTTEIIEDCLDTIEPFMKDVRYRPALFCITKWCFVREILFCDFYSTRLEKEVYGTWVLRFRYEYI